jgi:hypothetical protein
MKQVKDIEYLGTKGANGKLIEKIIIECKKQTKLTMKQIKQQ